jgi:putative chitinase
MRLRELLAEELAPPHTLGGWIYDKLNKAVQPQPMSTSTPKPAPAVVPKPTATPVGQSGTPAQKITPNSTAKSEPAPFNPASAKPTLEAVAKQLGITTANDLGNLLGHASVETQQWTKAVEHMVYKTADRVHKVFTTNFPTTQLAQQYLDLNDPVALANRAYANVNGNGNEASGDGWRYRGRGFLMISGKANYAAVGAWAHPKEPDIYVNNPELISSNPVESAKASVAWFNIKKLKGKSGKDVTVGINGATAMKNKERTQAAKAANAELQNKKRKKN